MTALPVGPKRDKLNFSGQLAIEIAALAILTANVAEGGIR
jgi:hypothetical protein